MSENKTQTHPGVIAPAWHTAVVLLILLGLVILSMHVGTMQSATPVSNRMRAYLVTIGSEWLLVAFIGLGERWRGASLRTLMGENSAGWRTILRDFSLAVGFLVVANPFMFLLGSILGRWMHPATSEAMKTFLPQSRLETAAFLPLALTAGICEEVIFRGYLQRQFAGLAKSSAVGIALQGIAFGVAHAYQGSVQVVLIAVYGCLFGLLAHWRRSLRSGMMSHFLQDGVGGLLLARFLLK